MARAVAYTLVMYFEIVGEIEDIRVIAAGGHIRDIMRLQRAYGPGRWRKLKGIAHVRIGDRVRKAEVHWYEAHGIGKRKMKIKHLFG